MNHHSASQGLAARTEPSPANPEKAGPPRRAIDGAALFDGRTEIDIHFGQSVYHLRITRQGKLILNK